MRIHKALVALLAITSASLSGAAMSACHVEGHAQVGGENSPQPAPPSPAPPPPASTTAEAPPPPAPAPRKVIELKGVQMKSSTQIDMPGDIEFQKTSSKIVMNDKTKKVLTQLALIMKDNPQVTKLSIEGNTDNEGETKGFDNMKLSQERAQSVIEWLTKNGVDAKRLTPVGNGSKNPLAANDTPDHMAVNRRVEFHVREFGGQPVKADEGATAGSTMTSNGATSAAGATAAAAAATPTADASKKAAKKEKGKEEKKEDNKEKAK